MEDEKKEFMANVAINGSGGIGLAALKIILDAPELNLVAAKDVAAAENLAYVSQRNRNPVRITS